ncbi:MAG TPA: 30S ribosomal protein S16 [Alphaproteobacteria bacterium]|nr:30S ribosomal protein S16 [Alphaproteobacteria bacterium]
MATKIRLQRAGAKKRPYYKIVVTDSRSARDGKFIEKLGTYNPLLQKTDANRVTLNQPRIEYWLSQGAEPSERVALLITGKSIGTNNTQVKNVLKRREISKKAVQAVIEAKNKAEAAKKQAEEAAAAAAAAEEAAKTEQAA